MVIVKVYASKVEAGGDNNACGISTTKIHVFVQAIDGMY
jgi:hypothetical protein